ncbi:MAG: adenylate/guanylate cyclase domain-containing protein [Proteobacteria bacterium]|nr:adenylate/guanylate cyclase domain-containing protein [Pseudomonadota bacterium]
MPFDTKALRKRLSNELSQRIGERRRSIEKRVGRHRASQALWGVVIGIVAALLFMEFREVSGLVSLEMMTYDWRMQATRGAAQGSGGNVALLYVDEPSLVAMKQMGISWPWPRELYAGALEFAKRGGARAVIFDLFFSEDSSYGLADDEAFAEGIRRGPPSYFVVFASSHETADAPPIETDVIAKSRVPFDGEPPGFLPSARSLQSLPVPEIADTATGFGNAQTRPDEDGVYRRLPLALDYRGTLMPQISLKVVSDMEGIGEIAWPAEDRLLLGSDEVPLDSSGNLMINYIGGVDSYPAYPLSNILLSNRQIEEGRRPVIDPAVLAGRIAIIGVAAPGLYDLKPMPLARVYPGPEIHATIIDSLLRRDFVTPLGTRAKAAIVFAFALAAALGLSQLKRFSHIVALLAGLSGAYLTATFVAFAKGLWLPVVSPMAAAAMAAFVMVLKNYMTEGRRKHAIKKAFGQYLSPAVVSEIALDPESVKMGGAEREVTVFFSDIADFTSIAERTAPADLVSQLCEYLTVMTEIITGREGTLDKYIGDAVMAFWGAPLAIPDHAAQAALAAMQIQDSLAAFAQFKTRIGIHTGRAVVGNIGSELRFNYTAIGDCVNLASRLEGLNKRFGTRVIISQSTFEAARHGIEARMIGKVRVKGRKEPISIYEPICAKGALTADGAAGVERFSAAMALFMAGRFAQAAEAFRALPAGGDPVVAYYAAVCDRFAKSPPAGGFDGVIEFHEK